MKKLIFVALSVVCAAGAQAATSLLQIVAWGDSISGQTMSLRPREAE